MRIEVQPEGPVEEADKVGRRACPLRHIGLRASPALIGLLNGQARPVWECWPV
jgi:hypothetical protein